jgi:sugar lactone lactonase YvrE
MKQIIGCPDRSVPFLQRRSSRRSAFGLLFAVGLALLALPGFQAAWAAEPPGTLVTVAGTGQAGFSGDGGPATQAALSYPYFISFDAGGDLFIACGNADGGIGNRVRRITPDGIIKTVAGSGKFAFSGDNGPATSAGLAPVAVAVDSADNLYIADFNNNRIRKVSASGTITTVAGGGNPADGRGDGGPATRARLIEPIDVAVDAKGNLFIAEHGRHRVRMVTPAGTISTVAGTGQAGFAGDGRPATAAQLAFPFGVVVDNADHLYIADLVNHRVRMVGPDGKIRTVAGGGNPADGVGDGGLATQARLDTPSGLAVDGAGNLFIADSRNLRIRRVGPVGIISTVVGTGEAGFSADGTPATQAHLTGPLGLAIDKAGNLYFSELARVDASLNFIGADNGRIREVVGGGVPR